MKKLVKTLALALVFVFCFSLVGCGSSYGKLEKAFANEGYTVSEDFESVVSSVKTELEKDELEVEFHVLEREQDSIGSIGYDYVIIMEFKATDDLVKACEESATLKGIITDIANSEDAKEFYNALVEEGWANGNCLVFTTNIFNIREVKKIVKNA